METVERMALSRRSLPGRLACVLSVRGLVITVGLDCCTNAHSMGKNRERLFVLPACQDLFNPLLILARNWKSQRDSW